MGIKDRMSITDVAEALGVTTRTIMRWEKAGKIRKSKRDWRGWRFYEPGEVDEIRKFYESSYEYDRFVRPMMETAKNVLIIMLAIAGILSSVIMCVPAYAQTANFSAAKDSANGVRETQKSVDIVLDELPVVEAPNAPMAEGVKYTLGPDDVIAVEVRRHPEFSGQYAVNSEGKIEYKYIGDVIVSGLTKAQAKERLTGILSEYLTNPDVDVQIVSYLSKVFYVVGEVGRPGKFFMKGDTITVREALIQSGLPTYSAAMRRCRLITPNKAGKNNYVDVDVFKLLYEGCLTCDLVMKPGDVLYIPATVLAKIIRVISPVTETVGQTAGAAAQGAAVAAIGL